MRRFLSDILVAAMGCWHHEFHALVRTVACFGIGPASHVAVGLQKQSVAQAGVAHELRQCQERARCLLNYSGLIDHAMPADVSAHLMSMENSML